MASSPCIVGEITMTPVVVAVIYNGKSADLLVSPELGAFVLRKSSLCVYDLGFAANGHSGGYNFGG